MWNISWDSTNSVNAISQDAVIKLIESINEEYKHKEPVIVQIESETHKILCIGIGSIEEFCCLDFFPNSNGLGSLHPAPQTEHGSERSIIFWMDSYDSEWELDLLISYQEAIEELSYFLKHDDVSTKYIWELD